MRKSINIRAIKENQKSLFEFIDKCSQYIIENNYLELKFKMICEKVFFNIIKYSDCNGREVNIVFEVDNEHKFLLEFRNQGCKFDLTKAIKSDFNIKNDDKNIGLNLISKLTDEIKYSYENEQNKLTLVINISNNKALKINLSEEEGVILVNLEGKIDTTTSPELDRVFSENLNSGRYFISVNLDKVDYISSTGLRSFLSAQKQVNKFGGKMTINNVSDDVYSVFKLTGFASIMKINKK